MHKKHATTVDGYFATPHQLKAKVFWEYFKIIDNTILTTIPVSTQVEFAASTETADVFIPNNYTSDKPVGIYIHMNAGDSAYLSANYQSSLDNLYCIGASPDHAGNDRHDPWRIARALDLVASLKDQYNVDQDRIYIGGFSGGALISMLAGMIYPDVFKGVVSTEHVIKRDYWEKIFTWDDMAQMRENNQRWAFIMGVDSYAIWHMRYNVDFWELTLEFDTFRTEVAGMAHSQPYSSTLEQSIHWVDAPAQRQRATTFQDWNTYCYDGSHSAANRDPEDDFDSDLIDNWTEYLLGLDPTQNDNPSYDWGIKMENKQAVLRYRRAAIDAVMNIDLSSDLNSWDQTGNNVNESSVVYDSPAFASCWFTSINPSVTRIFFRAKIAHTPLVNLARIGGVTASQSTTAWGGLAARAIDGNTNPDYNNNSITHTNETSANWWQVDLGATRSISRIVLFNRQQFEPRLSNFRISVLNSSGVEVAGQSFFTSAGHVAESMYWDPPSGTSGNMVKVTSIGNNRDGNRVISLAECEVWGPSP